MPTLRGLDEYRFDKFLSSESRNRHHSHLNCVAQIRRELDRLLLPERHNPLFSSSSPDFLLSIEMDLIER